MKLTAILILAGTLHAEARGEGEIGMRSVASTIWNRGKTGKPLIDVCLQHMQYSCWIDPEYMELRINKWEKENSDTWITCKKIAEELIEETFVPSGPWTNFYNPDVVDRPPLWAKEMKYIKKIGKHLFGKVE